MRQSTYTLRNIPALYSQFRRANLKLDQAEDGVDNLRDFVVDRVKPATMKRYKREQPEVRASRFEFWQRKAFTIRALELLRIGANFVNPDLLPSEFRDLGYQTPEDWEQDPEALSKDVIYSEFKGNPVISIKCGEFKGKEVRVLFGLTKAKAILKHKGEIYDFIMTYDRDANDQHYNPEE